MDDEFLSLLRSAPSPEFANELLARLRHQKADAPTSPHIFKATVFAAVALLVAPLFALPSVRAATEHFFAQFLGPRGPALQIDLATLPLMIDLRDDGSVTVSLGARPGQRAATLASIQALPAELDVLVPKGRDSKELHVTANADVPYSRVLRLVNEFRAAGFAKIGLVGPELDARPDAEPVARFAFPLPPPDPDPNNQPLFVSLANDGRVIATVGIPPSDPQSGHLMVGQVSAAVTHLVPDASVRARKEVYFRGDWEVTTGEVIKLLRELRAIGFMKIWAVEEHEDKR